MERDGIDGELKLTHQEQLTVAGIVAALGLILGFKTGGGWRRWRKRRPTEKHYSRAGGLKFTLKVKTPRRKLLDRS